MCCESAVVTTRECTCHRIFCVLSLVFICEVLSITIFITPTVSLNESVLWIQQVISNEHRELLHIAFLCFFLFCLYSYSFSLRRHATYKLQLLLQYFVVFTVLLCCFSLLIRCDLRLIIFLCFWGKKTMCIAFGRATHGLCHFCSLYAAFGYLQAQRHF